MLQLFYVKILSIEFLVVYLYIFSQILAKRTESYTSVVLSSTDVINLTSRVHHSRKYALIVSEVPISVIELELNLNYHA